MTALDKYIRLEATGHWHEDAGDGKEVVVSFGNATLVLSNFNDQPLAHWSLAALNIVDQSENQVVYSPDAGSPERLVVNDGQMIEAIEAVTKDALSFDIVPVKSHLLRNSLIGIIVCAVIAAAVWLGPNFLRQRAISLIPEERAVLLGGEVLSAMKLDLCTQDGNQGLLHLSNTLGLKNDDVIFFRDTDKLIALPGGKVLISDGFLHQTNSAEELSGWIALARQDAKRSSSLQDLWHQAPLGDVVTFLLRGTFHQKNVDWMAQRSKNYGLRPDNATLTAALNTLAEAGVPDQSFLETFARSFPDFKSVPTPNTLATFAPMMSDQNWVGLQEICGA